MTAVFDWVLGVAVAGWFGLTVIRNLPRVGQSVARRDPLVLVPYWWLFAKPRTHDPVLLRRTVDSEGLLSDWIEIPIIVDRPRSAFIWHPSLGPKRALLTFVGSVTAAARNANRNRPIPQGQGSVGANAAMTAESYVTLLNVASASCDGDERAVQFMLVGLAGQQYTGRWDTSLGGDVLLVSEFHRLDHQPLTTAVQRHAGEPRVAH